MPSAPTIITRHNPLAWLLALGAVAGTVGALPALAEPFSDPFATGASLERRAAGVVDPFAQECAAPSRALSLTAAVDIALCRNPATRSAWAAARQQAAALGGAESAWLPTISATGSGTRAFGPHVDPTGNSVSSTQNTADAALNLSWTLYDFGARSGRIASANRLLDAAAATAGSVAQQTVLNTVQAYYGAIAADANLGAAQTAEDAYRRGLEVARGRREGGAATLADVLQAETAFDSAVLARMQADVAAKQSHGTLAVTIGVNADQGFVLDSASVPAEVPSLRARMADLMAEAVSQRPDLAAARAQRDAALADVDVARAAGLPVISLGAARNMVDPSGFPHQNNNTLGITITVPVFTGFNVAYGVRQAQAALQAREVGVEQARLGVTLDVWNAYYALDSSNQQLGASAALLKSAVDNEQVALGRYQAGVGSIIDLLTAQAAAVTARQHRIAAELGWQVARTQLALALGRLSGIKPLEGTASLQ